MSSPHRIPIAVISLLLCGLVLAVGQWDGASENQLCEGADPALPTSSTPTRAALAALAVTPPRCMAVGEADDAAIRCQNSDAIDTHPLAAARDQIVEQCNAALDGVVFVNDVLDYMLQFSSLEVAKVHDFDYEDNDALAYNLIGAPEGTEARMLVGLQPFESEGGRTRYLQLEVDVKSVPSELIQGAIRYSPRIDLNIAYLETVPTQPVRFALNISRAVGFADSRDVGIDAYQGRLTEGAYFWVDLVADPQNPISGTYGVVDAVPYNVKTFGGVSPLDGDVQLDVERVGKLLTQLQCHLTSVKGG